MKTVLCLLPILFLGSSPIKAPTPPLTPFPHVLEEAPPFAKKSVEEPLPLEDNSFINLRDWMVKEMSKVNTPGHFNSRRDSRETKEEALERFEGIATDIITIAFKDSEEPLFQGEKARLNTALILFANTRYESYWRKDVELGISWKNSKGEYRGGRGDRGKSWCLTQMYLTRPSGKDGKTKKRIILDEDYLHWVWDSTYQKGIGGEDLVADRDLCLTAGLHYIRFSFNQCKKFNQRYWLSSYMGPGNCSPLKASKIHMNYFWNLIWNLKKVELDNIDDEAIAKGMRHAPSLPVGCSSDDVTTKCLAND